MLKLIPTLYAYRGIIAALAWKSIAVRYKQAYLGLVWTILKPVMLMLIFNLVRSFVGIESGDIPYPILTFAALIPWVFFQESASEGVNSVVSNSNLIRKIYFPREIFPLTSVLTKLIELGINLLILSGFMIYYHIGPTIYLLWLPIIVLYTIFAVLCISMVGAAMNVYYRDVATALPVVFSLMMYASPVIYPLSLVKDKLLVHQAAGEWSNFLYLIYTLNPLTGIIDAFQNVALRGHAPDFSPIWPGMTLTAILFPLSYYIFKRAESYFADVI